MILGLVERHAGDRVGTAVVTFMKSAASDEATWTIVEDAWRAQATAHADLAPVLANTGYFLMKRVGDDEKRENAGRVLLLRAHKIDPDEWRWTSVLGTDVAYRVFLKGERMTPDAAREALGLLLDLERTMPVARQRALWFAQGDLSRAIAHAAIQAGDLDEAGRRASAALASATPEECAWDCGNLTHAMHQILGTVALRRGDLGDAQAHLLTSVRISGSPQLDSFGPEFPLARDLLAKGAKVAVLEYLDLCAKFWTSGRVELAAWRKTIEAGGTPDFGIHPAPVVKPKGEPGAPLPPPSTGRPVGFAGLWESVETSMGGIGGAMELRADGTASVAMVVLVSARWTIEGGQLTMSGPDMGDPVTIPLGQIDADSWSLAGPDGKEAGKKKRVGKRPEGAAPIVGVWSSSPPMMGTAYERYDATGLLTLRFLFAGYATEGTWTSKEGTLSLAFQGKPNAEMAATIRDDKLSLTDAAGEVTEYRFAGRTSWYPLSGPK